MLRGIDVGGILNTPKELALLMVLKEEEDIDDLKTILIFKGAKLDNSDKDAVNEFNQLIQKFHELRNPNIKEKRKQAVLNKKEQLENLSKLDLSKLNFKSNKIGKKIKDQVEKGNSKIQIL